MLAVAGKVETCSTAFVADVPIHVASMSHGFAGGIEKSPEMLGIGTQHGCDMEGRFGAPCPTITC